MQLLARKSVTTLQVEAGQQGLRRTLGPLNLVLLGIGCILGAGIYVLPGTAAAHFAGPAVMLSFVIAGAACALTALCYAELASTIPVAGSAYTYCYAAMGEVFAWSIGWLLILDNADTEAAAAAVEELAPRLLGGHLLVTGRLTNWSHRLQPLPVDILPPDAAAEFLLARTATKRRPLANDNVQAALLAETLGYLALALEQAGAYICKHRLTFEDYLGQWSHQRDRVLAWYAISEKCRRHLADFVRSARRIRPAIAATPCLVESRADPPSVARSANRR